MKDADERKRYQEHPIYGTDFTKPTSVLIENIRRELMTARGHITDLEHGTGWGDRVNHVEGLLTCGLVALHAAKEEIAKFEVQMDDKKYGKSLRFGVRGLGLDMCPGCFVCGTTLRAEGANSYMNNISAFVSSKAEGEEIVSWFKQGARLDFRPHEPEWIQVKIGACNAHVPNLERLAEKTSVHGVLRQHDVTEAEQG